MALPSDPKSRKSVPIFSGVIRYFPDALAAVAELSRIGGEQHNPGKPLHWDRSKSDDELDALARHLIDAGTLDSDGVRHSAKVVWRALANLQKEIELESTQAPITFLEDVAEPRAIAARRAVLESSPPGYLGRVEASPLDPPRALGICVHCHHKRLVDARNRCLECCALGRMCDGSED
jgi:hypothetical protein